LENDIPVLPVTICTVWYFAKVLTEFRLSQLRPN